MSRRPLFVVVLCVACAGFGCAYGEIREVVRAQFASELDCGEVFIIKRDAWYQYENPNQFKVSGCGVIRTYTCPPDADGRVSYDEPACKWVEGDADAPKISVSTSEDEMLDESEELPPLEEEAPDDATEPPPADEGGDTGDGLDGADDPTDDADDADAPPASAPRSAAPKASGKAGGGVKIGIGAKKK